MAVPTGRSNQDAIALQDDCKVRPKPFMVSLSNHERLEQASFDKLRMSGRQWMVLLCNRPGLPWAVRFPWRTKCIIMDSCAFHLTVS